MLDQYFSMHCDRILMPLGASLWHDYSSHNDSHFMLEAFTNIK